MAIMLQSLFKEFLRFTTVSYPQADTSPVDSLAMGYFVDSISDAEMRLTVKFLNFGTPKVFAVIYL